MTPEQEDLEGLLHHPGWVKLTEHARKVWIDNLDAQMKSAVAGTDDLLALQKMRQVIVAKEAVEALLEWPTKRLRELSPQRPQDELSLARGGY